MKKLSIALCFLLSACSFNVAANTPAVEVTARSAILMEASTGKVLYEMNPNERLAPASVTKIMTMLLTMEALERGQITYEDMATVSARAESMGGSTIFLETGEQMSVHDLLKGLAVMSGNDAAVALAEHIAGSEEEFVRMMNARAAELGMKDSSFINTNGLDADNHYASAMDIAIMSRELVKYEKIFEYTTIWMDSLRDGKTQLANTNKLVRFYPGANGLKTGSTSKALNCLSATAKRDDMQLIAVVMASPSSKERFASASNLLDYGFAAYAIASAGAAGENVGEIPVLKGVKPTIAAVTNEGVSALVPKAQKNEIRKEVILETERAAPITKGDKLGEVKIFIGDTLLASVDAVAAENVDKLSAMGMFMKMLSHWMG